MDPTKKYMNKFRGCFVILKYDMLQVRSYNLNRYSHGRAVLLEVVVVSEKKSPPGRRIEKSGRWSSRWSSIARIGTESRVETGAKTRMSVTVVSSYSTSPIE